MQISERDLFGRVGHGIIPTSSDQSFLLESGLMDSSFSCLLALQTGGGKTRLSGEATRKVLEVGKLKGQVVRVAYIAPIKALAQAQYDEWKGCFEGVGIFNGDHKDVPNAFKNAKVLLLTPEKLDVCLRSPKSHLWLNDLELIVIDEIHTLADGQRGARLEGVILRLQMINPLIRVIGLSATPGDLPQMAAWLGAVFYQSSSRPVPLHWSSVTFRYGADRLNQLMNLMHQRKREREQCLVFCQSKRRTEILCAALRESGINADFHHAGRYLPERAEAERSFKSREIAVLCATSGLAMGLNLPAKHVIVYDLQRSDGMGFKPLSKREVVQMAGRAGRPGYDKEGLVTLFVHTNESRLVEYYSNAEIRCETVESQLQYAPYLNEQIIIAVQGGYANTRVQLQRMFSRTLAAHQGVLPDIDQTIQQMIGSGLLSEVDGKKRTYLKPTSLSQNAVRHLISPETVMCFQRALEQGSLTFLDLLIIVCATPDFNPLIPVRDEMVIGLNQRLEALPSSLARMTQDALHQILNCSANQLLKVIHTAMILRSWTQVGDLENVTQEFQIPYPIEVARGIESATRLLTALGDIANVAHPDPVHERSGVERIEALRQMVEWGLDEDALTLTRVPGVGDNRAKLMKKCGIRDVKNLATAEVITLLRIPGIALKSAEEYVRKAGLLANQIEACRDHIPEAEGAEQNSRINLLGLLMQRGLSK